MDSSDTPSTSTFNLRRNFHPSTIRRKLLTSTALALNFCSTLSEARPAPDLWPRSRDRDDGRHIQSMANKKFENSNVNIQRNSQFYGQQPLVHTFETQASCSRMCTLSCVMQNVEDLMMPRWICPSHPIDHSIDSSNSSKIDFLPFNSQLLLIIVPLLVIALILLVIFWVRRSSTSVASALDD